MKPTPLVLALLTLFVAAPAFARERDCAFSMGCNSSMVHVTSRFDPRDARLAINTEDGDATLLITDDVIAVQLSDHAMGCLRRKLHDEYDEDDNALAQSIKAVVFTTVRSVLNHSATCRIRDVRDVRYEDGRLEIVTNDRGAVFTHLDVDDDNVMRDFSDRDARAFVQEFHRVKARWQ